MYAIASCFLSEGNVECGEWWMDTGSQTHNWIRTMNDVDRR